MSKKVAGWVISIGMTALFFYLLLWGHGVFHELDFIIPTLRRICQKWYGVIGVVVGMSALFASSIVIGVNMTID